MAQVDAIPYRRCKAQAVRLAIETTDMSEMCLMGQMADKRYSMLSLYLMNETKDVVNVGGLFPMMLV